MNDQLIAVVAQAWSDGFTTKSTFARTHAEAVAEAACRGLITTLNVVASEQAGKTCYGNKWLVTPKGCKKLFKKRRAN